MYNDSVETLLTRHYGSTATTPTGLEQRLCTSLHEQARQMAQEERVGTHPMSRRRAVRLLALSSLSVGAMNVGLELLENVLVGSEATQNAAVR